MAVRHICRSPNEQFSGMVASEGRGLVVCRSCSHTHWDPNWRGEKPHPPFIFRVPEMSFSPDAGLPWQARLRGLWARKTLRMFGRFGLLPGLTYRPGQEAMAAGVLEALERRTLLLANAGVGIGKTYAYLLPALQMIGNNDILGPIVVATKTILLQRQMREDLARLQGLLGTQVPVLESKGEGQYLCASRLHDQRGQGSWLSSRTLVRFQAEWEQEFETLYEAKRASLRARTRVIEGRTDSEDDRTIRVYSDTAIEEILREHPPSPSRDGDQVDRLAFPDVSDDEWSRVRVEHDVDCKSCLLRAGCGWIQHQKARRTFQRGILVVNHGLLARDIQLRGEGKALWPKPAAVIVDEAHHWEEALRSVDAIPLSVRLVMSGANAAMDWAGRLGRDADDDDEGSHPAGTQRNDRELTSAPTRPVDLLQTLSDELSGLSELLAESLKQSRVPDDSDSLVGVFNPVPAMQAAVHRVLELEGRAKAEILAYDKMDRTLDQGLRRLDEWLAAPSDASVIAWSERPHGRKASRVCLGNLDIGYLSKTLDHVPLVLCSGTLGVRDDFSLVRTGLGLGKRSRIELYAPSPYDYQRQMRYLLPRGLVDPRTQDPAEREALDRQAAAALVSLAGEGRRILVLFTSKRQRDRVMVLMKESALGGTALMTDGEELSSELARKFRGLASGLYLSTAAWEGLDAPGTWAVVIARLPYPVPTDPWLAARQRLLGDREGMHTAQQAMMMRLTQGVGRLIRREGDVGTLVFLDARAEKRLPSLVRSGLPDAPPVTCALGELGRVVAEREQAIAR